MDGAIFLKQVCMDKIFLNKGEDIKNIYIFVEKTLVLFYHIIQFELNNKA